MELCKIDGHPCQSEALSRREQASVPLIRCWLIPLFTVPPVRNRCSWLAIGAGNFVLRKSNTTSTAFSAFSWVIPVLFTIRFITCSFMVNSRPAHDELRAGYCQKQPASCSPVPDLVSHHLSLLILLFPVFFFAFLILPSSFLILHSYSLALNIISVCWILFAVIWLLA